MARSGLAKLVRVAAGHGIQTTCASRATLPSRAAASALTQALPRISALSVRFISKSSATHHQGITPDNQDAAPKETTKPIQTPAEITDAQYHVLADEYMDRLLHHLEDLAEERSEMDVEYSAGVMTVDFGQNAGIYVINKQPPNKQIWLSSPKSGPKRYDYVVLGEGQHEKQDTAAGEWVYLRDGSTLSELFRNEIGVDISMSIGHYDGELDR
ncbi:putative Frataxin mitochondrial precursor [Triangularia setosa]|uniref:ferroxidase n=1 Tax=Triangularia setosa TaxID=2587417 RepID=A0AAN6WBA4_9PEZI|nr:putative Frataxin mitochondrial precursor [Podospora setosa]